MFKIGRAIVKLDVQTKIEIKYSDRKSGFCLSFLCLTNRPAWTGNYFSETHIVGQ
jgi:hypothetical protein